MEILRSKFGKSDHHYIDERKLSTIGSRESSVRQAACGFLRKTVLSYSRNFPVLPLIYIMVIRFAKFTPQDFTFRLLAANVHGRLWKLHRAYQPSFDERCPLIYIMAIRFAKFTPSSRGGRDTGRPFCQPPEDRMVGVPRLV